MPDQVVVGDPHAMPEGSKSQLCDAGMTEPVTQVPFAAHVLGVVVPIWVPVTLQPPPVCMQAPYVVTLPQSRPDGS
jgi:hypothetical protein